MQSTMQKEILTENPYIRIKNQYTDLPETFFVRDQKEWGLAFCKCYPVAGKIVDATFKIVDMKKFMLFLIRHPVKIYPITD